MRALKSASVSSTARSRTSKTDHEGLAVASQLVTIESTLAPSVLLTGPQKYTQVHATPPFTRALVALVAPAESYAAAEVSAAMMSPSTRVSVPFRVSVIPVGSVELGPSR